MVPDGHSPGTEYSYVCLQHNRKVDETVLPLNALNTDALQSTVSFPFILFICLFAVGLVFFKSTWK